MGKALGRIDKALKSDGVLAVVAGLGVAFGAMTVDVLTPIAAAQAQTSFPSRPFRMLVTIPPGGAPDISARLVAQGLQEAHGWTVGDMRGVLPMRLTLRVALLASAFAITTAGAAGR